MKLPPPLPGRGRRLPRITSAGAAASVALAIAATPGCLLAYRPPVATPAAEIPAPPPGARATPTEPATTAAAFDEPDVPEGVFHVVQAGQTLWRISRGYGVTVAAIVEANGIADPASIEVGAALFIPGAPATVDVAPFPAPPPTPTLSGVVASRHDREWIWPLRGEVLSRYGDRRRDRRHRGVDIRGRRGEEVVATRLGRVVFAGRGGGGYGLTVVLDHGEGRQSLYAHNESLLVSVGDEVDQGQILARCGRSGNATTEHVHFEIRTGNLPQDPLPLLGEILEARR